MIYIAHARISENGTVNGAAGDQTGGEVSVTQLTNREWKYIIRCVDNDQRDKIAETARACADNRHIGYGQDDRRGLYEAAKEKSFNIDKITKNVNCDCSSMVAVCVIAAGINVSPDMYTGNMISTLRGSGRFTILTYEQNNLIRGDIILCTGHTAVVVTGSKPELKTIETNIYASRFDKVKAGIYEADTAIYLREGNGVSYRAFCVIPAGGLVHCYGYWSPDINTSRKGKEWLLVEYQAGTTLYTGFVSVTWLTKKRKTDDQEN